MLQTWRVKLFCQGVSGSLCQLSQSVLWLIVILLKAEVDTFHDVDFWGHTVKYTFLETVFIIPTNDIWFCIWTNQKTESSKWTNQIDSQTFMNLDKLYLCSFWHTAAGRHLDGAASDTVGGARSTRGVNGDKHRLEYFCLISVWQMVRDHPLSFTLERGEAHSCLHHLNIYFASPAFQSPVSLSLWFRLSFHRGSIIANHHCSHNWNHNS